MHRTSLHLTDQVRARLRPRVLLAMLCLLVCALGSGGTVGPIEPEPLSLRCPKYDPATSPLPSQDLEPAETVAAGAIPGGFAVSQTGAATYSIPLVVPPGRAGMEPSLSISYSSTGGEGFLGVGFALRGLSAIDRCASNVAQDGFIRAVRFDDGDRLCLDGARLVQVAQTFGFDGAGTREYRTIPDTFVKVIAHFGAGAQLDRGPERFEVFTKAGHIVDYGATAPSRAMATDQRVATWWISKERDRRGNAMSYNYVNYLDPSDGHTIEIVPSSISYATEDNGHATRAVWMKIDDAPSISTSTYYRAGMKLRRSKLVTGVEMRLEPGHRVVRSYNLKYEPGEGTGRSNLRSIEECVGENGPCKPATQFAWTSHAGTGVASSSILSNGAQTLSPGDPWTIADVNGDGLPDVVATWADVSTSSKGASVALNQGAGFGPWSTWIQYNSADDTPIQGVPFDYDQDGRTDLLFFDGYYGHTADSNVLNANILILHAEPNNTFTVIDSGISAWSKFRLGDLDGDGVADLLMCDGQSRWVVHLWSPDAPMGYGFASSPIEIPSLEGTYCESINDKDFRIVDTDGDGKAEIVVPPQAYYTSGAFWNADGTVLCDLLQPCRYRSLALDRSEWTERDINLTVHTLSSADSTLSTAVLAGLPDLVQLNNEYGRVVGTTIFVDVNGDGLPDAVKTGYGDGRPRTFMNTGAGFAAAGVPSWSGPSLPDDAREDRFAHYATLMDYDGDGQTDLLVPMAYHCGDPQNATACWVAWQSDGSGTFVLRDTGIYFPADAEEQHPGALWNVQVLDANGDGRHDLVTLPLGGWSLQTLVSHGPQDLLLSITDGSSPLDPGDPEFIPTIEIAYGNLVDSAVTQGVAPSSSSLYVSRSDPANLCSYPRVCVVGPERVVKSYRIANGRNEQRYHAMRYRDGRYHRLGRGFLGFGERVTLDADNQSGVAEMFDNITYDEYWATFPYAGQAVRSLSWTSENPVFYNPGRVELTVTERTMITDATNAGRTYFTMPEVVRTMREEGVMPLVTGQDVLKFVEDAVATPLYILSDSVHTNILHDEYGNVIWEADALTGTDIQTSVIRTIVNDPATWLLGQLTYEQTCSSAMSMGQCRTTTFEHNAYGEVTAASMGDPDDVATQLSFTFEHDSYGHVVRTTADDALGHHRQACVSYDAEGIFPYAMRNPRGHTVFSKQDPGLGVVTATVDANGLLTRWRHDGFGRVMEEQRADGSGTTTHLARSKDGGPNKDWWNVSVTTTDRNGAIRTAVLNSLGREVRALTVAAAVETRGATTSSPVLQLEEGTDYDFYGRVQRVYLPWMSGDSLTYHQTHEYTYDASGRLTQHVEPWGRTTTFSHVGHFDSSTDWLGTSTIERDGLGRPVVVTDKLGDVTETYYGPFGGVLGTVRFGSEISTSDRDAYGRVIREFDADRGTTEITYDGFGNPTSLIDANHREYTFTYDALGRMKTRHQDDDQTTTWDYDSAPNGVGMLASVTNSVSTKQYTYNELSQLASVSLDVAGETQTLQSTFRYDSVGRLRLIAYPQVPGVTPLVVVHDYDAYGNLVTVRDNAGGAPFWHLDRLDGAGRPAVESYGNGAGSVREYDPDRGLVSRIETSGAGAIVQSMTYTYDQGLRMNSRVDYIRGLPHVLTELFTHDSLGRLRCSLVTMGGGDGPCTTSIDYDTNGNITQKSDVGTYTYDPDHPHAVQSAGGQSFVYDRVGNQVSHPQAPTISYTGFDLPKVMTLASGRHISLLYDGDQHRIVKQSQHQGVAKTTLYFEDLYERVSTDNAATVHRYYVAAGNATAVITRQANQPDTANSVAYLHTDALGSTEVVTGGGGSVLENRSYDAFGARRSPTTWHALTQPQIAQMSSSVSQVGFTGHEDEGDDDGDGSFSLVNMRGRIYDPKIGRFLQTDPIVSHPHFGQSWNPYSYVHNSPLNFVDPSGFQEEFVHPEITIVGTRPSMEQQLGGAIDLANRNDPNWFPWPKDSARDDQVAAGAGFTPQATREGSPFGPGSMGTMEDPTPAEKTGHSWAAFLGGVTCGTAPGCGAAHETAVQTGLINPLPGSGFGSTRFAWSLGVGLGGAFATAGGVGGEILGGLLTTTGVAAAAGIPAIAVSTGVVVAGIANTGAGAVGMMNAMKNNGDGGGEIKHLYSGVKNAPGYPTNFVAKAGGTTRNVVKNTALLEQLRRWEPGEWVKVYKDGWVGNSKVSLHYIQSQTGKVFDFKAKVGWSNE